MGLDMWLHRVKRNKYYDCNGDFHNEPTVKMAGSDYEVAYWRKNWDLHEYISTLVGGIENCTSYEITKEMLEKIIKFEKKHKRMAGKDEEEYWPSWEYTRKELNKILKETDFENENLTFSSWW